MKSDLINVQFGQTVSQQLLMPIKFFKLGYGPNFIITLIFTQVVTALIVAIAFVVDNDASPTRRIFGDRSSKPYFHVIFAFSPLAVILFAWDLSRLMEWTNFAAGILLCLVLDRNGLGSAHHAAAHRKIGPLALLTAAITGLVIYLGSPYFYSYYNFARAKASDMPLSLFDILPFSFWGNVMQFYNRRQLLQNAELGSLQCRLQSKVAIRMKGNREGDCSFILHEGDGTWGPYITLHAGKYIAEFHFKVTGNCTGGDAEVDVAAGDASVILNRRRVKIDGASSVSLPFEVQQSALVLQAFETRARSLRGCFILNELAIHPLSPAQ
jgi:hypothetical protein